MSSADAAVTMGVVAGMHTHTLSFARAYACSCLSVPAHAVVHPCCDYRWWQACTHHHLPMPVPTLFICTSFVSGHLCLLGCTCPHYLVMLLWLLLVLIGVCLGLFVLVQPLFMLIWSCLCLGVRGGEQIDGKKHMANQAIFGFITV